MEERTLASSERGLDLLYESEKVGSATAVQLTRQKEQLLNTESKLDEINSSLRQSERHLQGIRSVFGSIKNYFSGHSSSSSGQASGQLYENVLEIAQVLFVDLKAGQPLLNGVVNLLHDPLAQLGFELGKRRQVLQG